MILGVDGYKKRGQLLGRTISILALLSFIGFLPQLFHGQYLLHVIILANILAMFAVSWDLLAGFMGQLSLGHSMFFGAGAYTIGFISRLYNIPPIFGLIIGGLIASGVSCAVGIPCLRLKGPYYAIATLGFSQVLFTLSMWLSKFTGGEEGIHGIQKFIATIEGNYYFSFFLLLGIVISVKLLLQSPFGKQLISIREDVMLSEAAGINTSIYKICGAAISAFIAGMAGAYSSYYQSQVSPDTLSISLTFSVVAAVIFGGMGTVYGALLGAFALTFMNEYLYFIIEYRLLLYSLAIIFVLILSPNGLFGLLKGKLKAFEDDNTPSTEPYEKL